MTGAQDNNDSDLSILHRIAYNDKKITSRHLKELNIVVILRNINIENLSLKQASVIIIGLAKAISRKYKFLLEDCNHFLELLSSKQGGVPRGVRIPSSKAITLNVDKNLMVIDEDLFEYEDEFLALQKQGIEDTFMSRHDSMIEVGQSMFDVDFGDTLNVEQVRNSTLIGSEIFPGLDSVTVTLKKRKIAEDGKTEQDETIFRGNLRSVTDILLKKTGASVKDKLVPLIHIEDKIKDLFAKTQEFDTTIEHQREPSLAFDDIGNNDVFFNSIEHTEDKNILESGSMIFSLEDLPDVFIFNNLAQDLSVTDKSSAFNSLLELCSDGKIVVKQIRPFSEIECRRFG